jgi:hypothetical protein
MEAIEDRTGDDSAWSIEAMPLPLRSDSTMGGLIRKARAEGDVRSATIVVR